MKNLKGIFPALPTPFTKDDKINEKALEALVRLNMDKGVDGFYVGGSTSEAFLLTLDERKLILEVVNDTVKGKAAIIAHIGCIATSQAISLAKHAEKLKIDAISSVAPFYFKFSFEEIKNYYFTIVDNVNLPMIIYNFPGFSGVTFSDENIGEFMRDDRFAGIKHTSSDYFALERIKNNYKNKVIYNGFDEMFLAGLSMGADGGIGSTYNFMAEKFIQIKKMFEQNEIKEAQALQKDVNTIIKELLKVGVIPGLKEMLNIMGHDFGFCREPFRKVSSEESDNLKRIALPLL
ncbi:MAG: N-acetylneuraminate lyase [Eubacteriales bacterium]